MGNNLEIRIVKVEDAYKALMKKLLEMDEKLTGMDHVIRGNGRPGLVTKFELQEQRIKTLENNKKDWKDLIALCISGGLVALFTALVQHLIR